MPGNYETLCRYENRIILFAIKVVFFFFNIYDSIANVKQFYTYNFFFEKITLRESIVDYIWPFLLESLPLKYSFMYNIWRPIKLFAFNVKIDQRNLQYLHPTSKCKNTWHFTSPLKFPIQPVHAVKFGWHKRFCYPDVIYDRQLLSRNNFTAKINSRFLYQKLRVAKTLIPR